MIRHNYIISQTSTDFAILTVKERIKMAKEFEEAVDAVISGDTEMLKSLLEREPDLIRMRSSRAHRAMLIH